MNLTRNHIIIAVVGLAGAFALGRYTTSEKIKVETKTVYVEKTDKEKKQDVNTKVDKDRRTETVKTEVIKPDGTKITETRIIEDVSQNKTIEKNTQTKERVEKTLTQEHTEEKTMGRNRVTVSVLGGINVTDLTAKPVFGCHISKPILGPVTLGAFGLSSGVGGISVGLQF